MDNNGYKPEVAKMVEEGKLTPEEGLEASRFLHDGDVEAVKLIFSRAALRQGDQSKGGLRNDPNATGPQGQKFDETGQQRELTSAEIAALDGGGQLTPRPQKPFDKERMQRSAWHKDNQAQLPAPSNPDLAQKKDPNAPAQLDRAPDRSAEFRQRFDDVHNHVFEGPLKDASWDDQKAYGEANSPTYEELEEYINTGAKAGDLGLDHTFLGQEDEMALGQGAHARELEDQFYQGDITAEQQAGNDATALLRAKNKEDYLPYSADTMADRESGREMEPYDALRGKLEFGEISEQGFDAANGIYDQRNKEEYKRYEAMEKKRQAAKPMWEKALDKVFGIF